MNCIFPGAGYLPDMHLRTIIFLVLAAAGALVVSSCNTVSGMGEDLQRAGQGIENTSQGRSW